MAGLTEREAYAAMYAFLADLYERTKSDALGAFLGGMSFLPDGQTADPALWHDWLECVERARKGEVDLRLNLRD